MRKLCALAVLLMSLLSLPAMAQEAISVPNAGTTGTTLNMLAKFTGAPSTAVLAATTDTDNVAGICLSGCGTTGNALIAKLGTPNCVFDATTVVAGDYVTISSTTAGACHDAGSTRPSSGQVIGRALASGAGAGGMAMGNVDSTKAAWYNVNINNLLAPTAAAPATMDGQANYTSSGANTYMINSSVDTVDTAHITQIRVLDYTAAANLVSGTRCSLYSRAD